MLKSLGIYTKRGHSSTLSVESHCLSSLLSSPIKPLSGDGSLNTRNVRTATSDGERVLRSSVLFLYLKLFAVIRSRDVTGRITVPTEHFLAIY